jgi:hypothetical protein
MAVYPQKSFYDKGNKAKVVLRRLTWGVKEDTVVRYERPIVVLAATIDSRKGLFVK